MVLCRAVDTLLLYFGFSGCPFVSTDLGVSVAYRYALHIFAAWVGCHSFIFFPLLLHEIPYVELFKTFRDYQFFFHCHLFNFHRRFVIKVEVYATGDFHLHLVQFGKQLRSFQIGEDLSGLPLLFVGRVVLSGYADGFPDFVKADPGCLSLVRLFIFRLIIAELQFLRRYAREGFIELFLRDLRRSGCAFRVFVVKVASSSDSSMPFPSGSLLRRYGSGCPGGCHPETALADDARLFFRGFLMCCLTLCPFVFQRPPQSGNPLEESEHLGSMMRS